MFTRDIVAYNDVELDQYLEANGRFVKVEDPENLMRDKDFIQRLRARTGASDLAQSPPIDLNHVSARLGKIPLDGETSPRYPSPATTLSIDEEEEYQRCLEEETRDYNALVHDGGRPSHPVSLGPDVAKNPGLYREIFSYWREHDQSWMVFWIQLLRWEDFRCLQRTKRQNDRFPAYSQQVQDRLVRHGFERLFQLDKEIDRQDKMTTWIEYLSYEYVTYERDARFVQRHQPRYDVAWKELVDSKVLKPSEFAGREDDEAPPSGFQIDAEWTEAKQAVESATLATKSAEIAYQKACQDLVHVDQKLSTARANLAAATKSLEVIGKRGDAFIRFWRQTKQYRIARSDTKRQSILLQWILKQIPSIELELQSAKLIENNLKGENGKRLKRKRTDNLDEELVAKRKRQPSWNQTDSKIKTRASTCPKTYPTQQPRQTRSSSISPKAMLSDPHSLQAVPVSLASNTRSYSRRSGKVKLDDSTQTRKREQCRESSSSGTREAAPKRVSRRLARELPEFDMLSDQGVALQLPKTPQRRRPNDSKRNIARPLRNASSNKNSIPVKGAKLKGITKPRQERTNYSKRSKVRSNG